MASLADLFVRIRGDTSDVESKLLRVEKGFVRFGSSANGAKLSVNTLTATITSLASQVTNVNPAVARLTSLVGSLAVGGPIIAGAIAGLTAMAGLYERLTRTAREAMEASDKLIESYLKAARIRALGVGGQQRADIQDIAKGMAAHAQRAGFLSAAASMFPFLKGFQNNDLKALADGANATQAAVNELGLAIAAANEQSVKTAPHVKEVAVAFGNLREGAAKVNAEMQSANRDWWKGYIERTGEAIDITGRLEDKLIALLAKGTPLENLPGFGTAAGKPLQLDIPSLVGPAVDSATKINDVAKENARMLSETISSTAAQTASIIGNALVSFGSGRGNQIGGALGGSLGGGLGTYIAHQLTTEGGAYIGGALGSAVGSVIPVVGTLVGGFLGSAIGGLFGHHKKAVDANTQALNANTKVMSQLLNEPSGFKVGRARYDATEVMSAITRAALDHRSRGGSMPWAVAP